MAETARPPRLQQAAKLAERIARQAHRFQTDRAEQPYIGHIERVVANLLRRWPDAADDEIAAAWLHDVIEDTEWTAYALRKAGIAPCAVAIVEELTRPDGPTYLGWIEALAASGSLSAVRVKLADNDDNTDPARVAAIPDGPAMLARRYRPARAMLEARLRTIATD
jgi:(p)ppGpp synthase/HD superfamily hydrolase